MMLSYSVGKKLLLLFVLLNFVGWSMELEKNTSENDREDNEGTVNKKQSPFMIKHIMQKIVSYLLEEQRKELRYTNRLFATQIPLPNYIRFRNVLRSATARLETNFGVVKTSGDPMEGGNSSRVQDHLKSGVQNIFSTYGAFAALKVDGSVITWGNPARGGNSKKVSENLQSDVQNIFSTKHAFAALKVDGSVITWGNPGCGGDSKKVAAHLQSDVQNIFSTDRAFAALKVDGSVITWGSPGYGGDSSEVAEYLQFDVQNIFSTDGAFAALKRNGSIITWGNPRYGGDSSNFAKDLESDVQNIVSTEVAFAALKGNGRVISWGNLGEGTFSYVADSLSTGIVGIEIILGVITKSFRATKNDGTQVTWK